MREEEKGHFADYSTVLENMAGYMLGGNKAGNPCLSVCLYV